MNPINISGSTPINLQGTAAWGSFLFYVGMEILIGGFFVGLVCAIADTIINLD